MVDDKEISEMKLKNINFDELNKKKIGRFMDMMIYLVNGKSIRKIHTYWIGGGHNLIDHWINDNEIWVEDMKDKNDSLYFGMHEIFEYCL
jgi:hypothetical protein